MKANDAPVSEPEVTAAQQIVKAYLGQSLDGRPAVTDAAYRKAQRVIGAYLRQTERAADGMARRAGFKNARAVLSDALMRPTSH